LLAATCLNDLDEPVEGAVIGLLDIRRENAGGKLIELKVEGNTLAALALSGA